jgi:hypothetical protein
MKKATSPKAKTAASPINTDTVTGIANRPFRLDGTFIDRDQTVTLSGEQVARYRHFLKP